MSQFVEATKRRGIDDNWKRVEFRNPYSIASRRPLVFAAMQTFEGRDSATVRIRNLNRNKFHAQIEEGKTADSETQHHAPEEVGYFTVDLPGEIWNEGRESLVGMAGLEEIKQPDPEMNMWFRVELPNHFKNPVVFAQVLTHRGGQAVHPRIAAVNKAIPNVRDASFFYKLEEWKEDTHEKEWVAWLVLDIGDSENNFAEFRLDGFSDYKVIAGKVPCNDDKKSVAFSDFRSTPVVFSQCQSFIGPDPVVTRQHNVRQGGFDLWLQEAEAYGNSSTPWHTTETVGYIAVETTH